MLPAKYFANRYKPELISAFPSYFELEKVHTVLLSTTFDNDANYRRKYFFINYAINRIPAEKIYA